MHYYEEKKKVFEGIGRIKKEAARERGPGSSLAFRLAGLKKKKGGGGVKAQRTF